MKAFRLFPLRNGLSALTLGLLALQIAPCWGQVTAGQLANGLVDFYPLDTVLPGNVTPDIINRRDMVMFNMTSNNIVPASHPGMGGGSNCFNFDQSGGRTIIYYQSTGQNPLDGSGDFLPFINQRGATMNFWVKGSAPANDLRVMAENADNGDANPFFSLSAQPSGRNYNGLGYFLRLNVTNTDANGVMVNQLSDGTYQTPAYFYKWLQFAQYTTNTIFDNSWHMVTTEIGTNGDVHVFVDGNYDSGNQATATLDHEGNAAICPPLDVTNTYYVTNTYPFSNPPTNSPPPDGYVHWMVPGLNLAGTFTAFGGFDRNGNISAGVPCQMSDIGFWNRALSQDEIKFLMTNGLADCILIDCSLCHPSITSFSASPGKVHPGESVSLQWHIQAITSTPIVSLLLNPGIGEVTNVTDFSSGNGLTNSPVFTNTTFTLSLTNLNNCGYPVAQFPRYASVTVVPLSFSGMSYLLSDPANAYNPSFAMTWNSITNHTYTIQRKLSLLDPTWTTLTSGLASGGNSTSFTDYTLGLGTAAFYRVVCP